VALGQQVRRPRADGQGPRAADARRLRVRDGPELSALERTTKDRTRGAGRRQALSTGPSNEKSTSNRGALFWERHGPESNRRIELLQSSALPLGHRAGAVLGDGELARAKAARKRLAGAPCRAIHRRSKHEKRRSGSPLLRRFSIRPADCSEPAERRSVAVAELELVLALLGGGRLGGLAAALAATAGLAVADLLGHRLLLLRELGLLREQPGALGLVGHVGELGIELLLLLGQRGRLFLE